MTDATHEDIMRAVQTNRWAIHGLAVVGAFLLVALASVGLVMHNDQAADMSSFAASMARTSEAVEEVARAMVEVKVTQENITENMERIELRGTFALDAHSAQDAEDAHR